MEVQNGTNICCTYSQSRKYGYTYLHTITTEQEGGYT